MTMLEFLPGGTVAVSRFSGRKHFFPVRSHVLADLLGLAQRLTLGSACGLRSIRRRGIGLAALNELLLHAAVVPPGDAIAVALDQRVGMSRSLVLVGTTQPEHPRVVQVAAASSLRIAPGRRHILSRQPPDAKSRPLLLDGITTMQAVNQNPVNSNYCIASTAFSYLHRLSILPICRYVKAKRAGNRSERRYHGASG